MPLLRVPAAFDASDWIFELKHDGFRAFAIVSGHRCTLVSRRGHVFSQWPQLAEELARTIKADHAVLDRVDRYERSAISSGSLVSRSW